MIKSHNQLKWTPPPHTHTHTHTPACWCVGRVWRGTSMKEDEEGKITMTRIQLWTYLYGKLYIKHACRDAFKSQNSNYFQFKPTTVSAQLLLNWAMRGNKIKTDRMLNCQSFKSHQKKCFQWLWKMFEGNALVRRKCEILCPSSLFHGWIVWQE